VRYLLDTQSFLWFVNGDEKLSRRARSVMEDVDNECLFSAASIWEIAIKHSFGKLHSKIPLKALIIDQVSENGFAILPITQQHTLRVASLHFYHRDPFDRHDGRTVSCRRGGPCQRR
jgi:PIN domain nuclease of toxin-antitoxin system